MASCRRNLYPLTGRCRKVGFISGSVAFRVSSVLNRDVKQFGKKFMFDSNEETCWNSDQVTRVQPNDVSSRFIYMAAL